MTISSKPRNRTRRTIATLVTVVALFIAPAAAFGAGGDPTNAEYDSTLTQISAGGPGPEPPAATAEAPSGSLPFTGFDVAAMAAVAGGLGLAGWLMRRRVLGSDTGS
jgi:hypothetical protein